MLQRFFSQEFLLKIVRIGKRTLFPNGYPAPPPIDPTPQEQAEMRAKLLAWKGHGAAGISTCHFCNSMLILRQHMSYRYSLARIPPKAFAVSSTRCQVLHAMYTWS